MNLLLAFTLGLLVSDWLTTKLARLAIKLPSAPAREFVRNFSRDRGIDLKEKGRIVKTSHYDALDAFDEAENVLDALDKVPHEPAE